MKAQARIRNGLYAQGRVVLPTTPSASTSSLERVPDHDLVQQANEVLTAESRAIQQLAYALIDDQAEVFAAFVSEIANCSGNVVCTGIGKAGWIAQKLSATFASTGIPSFFLHPAEAMHGDLGRVAQQDVCLVFSFSGETQEITRLLGPLRSLSGRLLAVTGAQESTLATSADRFVLLPQMREACSQGLAPTTSTTTMLAFGDALAVVAAKQKGFNADTFAKFHPGGSLGKRLSHVHEVMRPIAACRIASSAHTIEQVLLESAKPGRRTGAVMLLDASEKLVGIFTDSDLAKLLERTSSDVLQRPIADVMTTEFRAIHRSAKTSHAVGLLQQFKISELPVIDEEDRAVGMIDITDVVGVPASLPPCRIEELASGANQNTVHCLTKSGTGSSRTHEPCQPSLPAEDSLPSSKSSKHSKTSDGIDQQSGSMVESPWTFADGKPLLKIFTGNSST